MMQKSRGAVDGVRYGRRSTDKQDASLDDQRSWAVRACQTEHIRIVAEFEDDGIPGDEIARRQGLQDLFAFVEAEHGAGRPISCLVVWDLDRLSRADSVKTAVILDRLREAGVTQVFTQEGWIDLNDEITVTLQHIKQDFSRRGYSKSLSKNVARSCLERANRGKWCGGRPPYGYAIGQDKHLVLDDRDNGARGDAVTWMFDAYDSRPDLSLSQLAKELDARDVPPPEPAARKGAWPGERRWHADSVRCILRNPLYTGDMHYGRRACGKYHRVANGAIAAARPRRTESGKVAMERQPDDSSIVTRDAHPALVAREQFQSVQAKLRRNHRLAKCGKRHNGKWLFAGLLRCGFCGKVMWGECREGMPPGYVCASYRLFGRKSCTYNYVVEDGLLGLIMSAISDYFTDPKTVAAVKENLERRQRAEQMELDVLPRLRRRAVELTKQIQRGSERLTKVPDDLFQDVLSQIRSLKDQLAEAKNEIASAERTQQHRTDATQMVQRSLERLQRLPEEVEKGDRVLLRETIRSLIAEIELHFEPAERQSGKRESRYHFAHGKIVVTGLAKDLLGMEDQIMPSPVQRSTACRCPAS